MFVKFFGIYKFKMLVGKFLFKEKNVFSFVFDSISRNFWYG